MKTKKVISICFAVFLICSCLSWFHQVFAKEKKKAAEQKSHRFFAFDDAPYFTSSDKRIGAKMLIDSTKVVIVTMILLSLVVALLDAVCAQIMSRILQ